MAEKYFCDLLVESRVAMNLAQKQAAEKLGISARGYQNYEYGVRIPTGGVLLKLIKLYNLHQEEVQKSIDAQISR